MDMCFQPSIYHDEKQAKTKAKLVQNNRIFYTSKKYSGWGRGSMTQLNGTKAK